MKKPTTPKESRQSKGAATIAACRARMANYTDAQRAELNNLFKVIIKGVHV